MTTGWKQLFVVLLCGIAWSQAIDEAAWEERFSARNVEPHLSCRFSQLHPALNFGPLSETGYQMTFPYAQFTGSGHALRIYLRVTATGVGTRRYFLQRLDLPTIPATTFEGRIGGAFHSAPGSYTVDALAVDEKNRTCEGQWQIRVPTAFSPPSARPLDRVTILVDAAPVSYLTGLQPVDLLTLRNAIASVIAEVPAKSVSLTVFNLGAEAEIFRTRSFSPGDLETVADRLRSLQLGTVSAGALASRQGAAAYVVSLVNRELEEAEPSQAVIFLGPLSRYRAPVSRNAFDKSPGRAPRFFYIQYRPPPLRNGGMEGQGIDSGASMGAGSGFPGTPRPPAAIRDTISLAMERLGGHTDVVMDRKSFAGAIERIMHEVRLPNN